MIKGKIGYILTFLGSLNLFSLWLNLFHIYRVLAAIRHCTKLLRLASKRIIRLARLRVLSLYFFLAFMCIKIFEILNGGEWFDVALHVHLHYAIYIVLLIKILTQHQFNLENAKDRKLCHIYLFIAANLCTGIMPVKT